MTEILTESFCERCGTRYTFESSAPRRSRIGRVKVFSRGVRNFVLSDDSSFSEAMADARSEQELNATAHQLDAFHRAFNFCLNCRQYTCGACWNGPEGRCLTCAPDPTLDAAQARVTASTAPEPAVAAAFHEEGLPIVAEAAVWPDSDVSATRLALVLGISPTEEAETESEAQGEAQAEAKSEAEGEAQAEAESEAWIEDRAAVGTLDLAEAAAAVAAIEAASPAGAASPDELAAVEAARARFEEPAVPEPVRVKGLASGQSVADAVAAYEAQQALAAEPEPELAAAEPEPEAEAAAVAAEPESEAEAEVAAAGPEAEVAAAEPEPEPRREDNVPQPSWPVAATSPELTPTPTPVTPPAPSPAPAPAQPVPSPWLAVAPDDNTSAPRWPAAPVWPSSGARRDVPLTIAGRPILPQGDASALWAASAREVLSGAPAILPATGPVTARPCVECGLSLSANARFCRRCGARQG
ncbi:MAG TPA: zinc ribbon domain-containing protein [Candidatus Limnocylindrales bacterium]